MEKENISKKIKALLDKTTKNGCTESEALQASETAAKLMHKYNLTLSEVEFKASDYILLTHDTGKKRTNNYEGLLVAVGEFTDTLTYIEPEKTVLYRIFGTSQDAEFALYLVEMLIRTVKGEADRFKHSSIFQARRKYTHGKILVNSFIAGMIIKISQRLEEIKNEQISKTGSIVLYDRMKIVKRKFQETMRIELEDRANNNKKVDNRCYFEGMQKGNSVNLNRPLNENSSNTKKIALT